GNVANQADVDEDDGDDRRLQSEGDPPGEIGGDEAAEERTDRGGNRGGGADEGIDPALGLALEVAVDEGLHRRQEQRGAGAADERPEDDDRRQALGEHHRHGTDRVADQPQHVGAPAADQVSDLAADQDERRRDQRLQGDGGLDPADGGVE